MQYRMITYIHTYIHTYRNAINMMCVQHYNYVHEYMLYMLLVYTLIVCTNTYYKHIHDALGITKLAQ